MLRLDSLVKHFGLCKCTKVRCGVAIGEFFSCPTNQHVKNEKLLTFAGFDTIIVQVANQEKAKNKSMLNLLQYNICCSKAALR
jgi:hypothetical protein